MKDMVVKAQQAAAALGITLDFTAVTGPTDFEAAFASMSSSGVEALFEFPSQMLFLQRQRLSILPRRIAFRLCGMRGSS
jgi:hypothetical protein